MEAAEDQELQVLVVEEELYLQDKVQMVQEEQEELPAAMAVEELLSIILLKEVELMAAAAVE